MRLVIVHYAAAPFDICFGDFDVDLEFGKLGEWFWFDCGLGEGQCCVVCGFGFRFGEIDPTSAFPYYAECLGVAIVFETCDGFLTW